MYISFLSHGMEHLNESKKIKIENLSYLNKLKTTMIWSNTEDLSGIMTIHPIKDCILLLLTTIFFSFWSFWIYLNDITFIKNHEYLNHYLSTIIFFIIGSLIFVLLRSIFTTTKSSFYSIFLFLVLNYSLSDIIIYLMYYRKDGEDGVKKHMLVVFTFTIIPIILMIIISNMILNKYKLLLIILTIFILITATVLPFFVK